MINYEGAYLPYGKCPSCGKSCQPELINVNDPSEEYVVCCDCKLIWNLHHEDPTDPNNETEPWRTYRISDIETFDTFGAIPYECKEK